MHDTLSFSQLVAQLSCSSDNLMFYHFPVWQSCWLSQAILLQSSKSLNFYANMLSLYFYLKNIKVNLKEQLHLKLFMFALIFGI